MIIDTSFLIDLMRKDPGALALLDRLESGSGPLQIPAPVFFELWEGIERSASPVRELAKVNAILEDHHPLYLTPEAARRAGRASGALVRRGEMVDDIDLLIAGTAVEEDAPIITRNARDFERIEGVRVLTY